MGRKKVEHFDCASLVRAIYAQPIGLRIVTNHPAGFRRILYLHLRKHKGTPVNILQCPEAPTAFLLVRGDFSIEGASDA